MSQVPALTPHLSPKALADLVDIHPDTVRNWRVHGLIDAYGTQEPNGYWTYSLVDAVALWGGWTLIFEAKLRERSRALDMSYAIAPDIIAAVRGEGGWVRYRASVYTDNTAVGGTRGWEAWPPEGQAFDSLDDLPAFAVVDSLVDIEAIAAMVPPELRAAIVGADEES